MKTVLPKALPKKSRFFKELLSAAFPEINSGTETPGANEYKAACRRVIKELGLADKYSTSGDFTGFIDFTAGNGDFYSVLHEMNEYNKRVFSQDYFKNNKQEKQEKKSFESKMVNYNNALYNLVSSSAKTMESLLDEKSSKIYRYFETASFFSWLLLKRRECAGTSRDFFEYCLKILGVEEYGEELKYCENLSLRDRVFANEKVTENGVEFCLISDTGARLLILSIFLICALLGRYPDKGKEQISEFYEIVSEEISEKGNLIKETERSQERLLEKVKVFKPRSVTKPGSYFVKDFFVLPLFEKDGKKCDPPLTDPGKLKKSTRILITGKTGFGKSMYMRHLTRSILERGECVVINVSAKDFSDCYRNRKYREWTKDFIRLFFMKDLSESGEIQSGEDPGCFFEKNTDHLTDLAKEGKLILVLDSFDEIPQGKTRNAYLTALRKFCTEYCVFLEKGAIGAHVIMASREMHRETMEEVNRALLYDEENPGGHVIRLKGLDPAGKTKLMENWQRISGEDDLVDELHELMESNHFFRDASDSPYTLTLMCAWFGESYGSMTGKYMDWLERRLRLRFGEIEDTFVKKVLSENYDLLKRLALETLKGKRKEFDAHMMQRVVDIYIEEKLPDAEYIKKKGQIREILLMQSGLLTPAEGGEELYTFADENLRYAFASKKATEILFSEDGYERFKKEVIDQLSLFDCVNVLVRVICEPDMRYASLVCRLVCDMLLLMTDTTEEERCLVTGIADLLLNRYKVSLISAAAPGKEERRLLVPVQRLMVLRVMASGLFKTDKKELEKMRESEVCIEICKGLGIKI